MTIEFQYFDGCPNAEATLAGLSEVIHELGIGHAKLNIVQVSDENSAKIQNFQGSPTILIDGVDMYTAAQPSGHTFSCRVL